MRNFEQWMNEYGANHKNPTNQIIHKICVPLIMLTVIGFFWAIPVPGLIARNNLNWALPFVLACLIFYFTLSFKMFMAMTFQSAVMLGICALLDLAGILLPFCVTVFAFAWIAQFYGHKIEGKKPSFLQDLAFLLIGPLWVTRFLYQKFGINA